ncbi:MAG: hypothetical protein U1E38_06235 [Rhodospirillales bacterium]
MRRADERGARRHGTACCHRTSGGHCPACCHRAARSHGTACCHRAARSHGTACRHRTACGHGAACRHCTACGHGTACRHCTAGDRAARNQGAVTGKRLDAEGAKLVAAGQVELRAHILVENLERFQAGGDAVDAAVRAANQRCAAVCREVAISERIIIILALAAVEQIGIGAELDVEGDAVLTRIDRPELVVFRRVGFVPRLGDRLTRPGDDEDQRLRQPFHRIAADDGVDVGEMQRGIAADSLLPQRLQPARAERAVGNREAVDDFTDKTEAERLFQERHRLSPPFGP